MGPGSEPDVPLRDEEEYRKVFAHILDGAQIERHPNSQRFHDLLAEAGALHDRKQADYGKGGDPFANVRASANWGMPGWVGAMVRLNDKVTRLQKVACGGTLANEGVADSMMDIAVYALIALVLFEQDQQDS